LALSTSSLTINDAIQISGAGFQPYEPVLLMLVLDDIVVWQIGSGSSDQPTANASGAFSASYDSILGTSLSKNAKKMVNTITAKADGAKTILAIGQDGSKASAPVTLSSAAAAPVGSAAASLSVAATEQGGVVTALGSGFKTNEYVILTLKGASSGVDKLLVGGSANASGAFSLEGKLAWKNQVTPVAAGVYTLLATGDGGSVTSAALVILASK
jgi:hypothetical protein